MIGAEKIHGVMKSLLSASKPTQISLQGLVNEDIITKLLQNVKSIQFP